MLIDVCVGVTILRDATHNRSKLAGTKLQNIALRLIRPSTH